jgi:O-antigen/teichoic acid export membrane protein
LKNNIKSYIRHLLKSELLRNTSVLISGTLIAQVIPVLLQPFLRRFFSPDTFGAYSVYLSIVGILIMLTSLRYESAIVLPKRDKEAANLLALALAINFIFSLLILTVILLFRHRLLILLNLSVKFILVLYLIPAGTFMIGTFQAFNYWLIRKKGFMEISVNKIVRRSTEGIFQIFFSIIKNAKGLLFGDLAGQISNVTTVIIQAWKNEFRIDKISTIKVRYVSKKYSEFPKYNLIPSFMSACSYLMPVIFINKFFNSEYTGYFDLSRLLLSLPLALIASSVSSVLLQKVSECFQLGKSFLEELTPVIILVLVVSLFEILIISFFGVGLFSFIFGKVWGFSGEMSRFMVWSYSLNFIVTSFSTLFIAMRRIKVYSAWQLFYFIAILMLIFFRNQPFMNFIKLYVLTEIICYLLAAALLFSLVLNYEKKVRYIAS